ncbi:AbfB domain-containing protein [Frigoribacterium sp. CFBP 8754]|uniref:glycoside hydrolase family 43 protein n=1 Tax=Frigoribacterium sp. CFBP 8754 TaxID=2775290 RepID=UPI00177F50E6|nr:glycoside hydrolase family 43 protein [Frigoribacterium sp. CFBP 8754]MBD8660998.1 AbfB domain-containing protein [Frigoribacterium sp. CFBP 8754]
MSTRSNSIAGPGRSSWRRRLGTIAASAALIGAFIVASPQTAPAEAATANSAYVMAYFRESPNGSGNSNNVHLAVSKDALEWTALNDNAPILVPTLGTKGIRDPFLFRLQDGSWVMTATDLKNENFGAANPSIHIWTSPDLVNWSSDRLLNINSANPNSFTWAPAIFWDPARAQYGITFSASPTGGPFGTILVVYTSDFVTTTAPVTFFDNNGQGGVIDSDVQTDINGVNYLYYRSPAPNQTGLMGARSSSLTPGSFTPYTTGLYQGGCVEAPTVVRSLSDPNSWWLWGDNYCPNNKFNVWQGSVTTGSWTPLSQRNFTAPIGSKHNSIQPITSTEYNGLTTKYGQSSSTRLKSSNFPDRYVRHQGGAARIDAFPFDPQQDSQWKIVPGLADPSAVSFESVNFPGQYLRHSNFSVVLNANDGSAGFAADATFKKVAGLSDPSWSSFQSYNYPTRYLRHRDFSLRIDPLSSSEYADATFRLVP